MVKLDRIYTRGGDKGETSLGDGSRVPKHDPRVAAYGTVDEANAVIGLAVRHADENTAVMLRRIQNDLFDVGADLCMPERRKPKFEPLRVAKEQVERLETEIDRMNTEIEPLRSFVLPGGSEAAAWLHLARTVVRRAERDMIRAAAEVPVSPLAIAYINRLSDHLFVLARYLNERGRSDVPWVPGQNR